MEIHYFLHEIAFVWHKAKAYENLKKHGIPFERAAEVFFDPFLKIVDASQNDEERDAIIGMDEKWNLLFVVHVESGEDEIRIISAREATRQERLYYENG